MATAITESLRAEHRALLAKLDVLRVLGRTVDTGKPGQTDTVLDAAISMLRRDLLPHAHAEEAVLYPAVERAMGAPGAMATMVAAIAGRTPRGDQIEDLRAQVLGLWAILLLHFEKEEDVLLPVLDEHLTADRARVIFNELQNHELGTPNTRIG